MIKAVSSSPVFIGNFLKIKKQTKPFEGFSDFNPKQKLSSNETKYKL